MLQWVTEIKTIKPLYKKRNLKRNNPFYSIEQINYNNVKDEIIRSKLDFLETISKDLPNQEVYGYFYNTDHHLYTQKLLDASTKETKKLKYFFLKNILPTLQNHDNLLDVGPGNGGLHKLIRRPFSNVTTVDIQEKYLDNLRKTQRKHKNNYYLNGDIQDVTLPIDHYDLAVLSHVLYYCDESSQFEIIRKMLNSVKVGGQVVIVLSTGLTKAKLVNKFQGQLPNVDSLIAQCVNKLSASTKIYNSKSYFISKSMKAMLHIMGIFLHNSETFAIRDDLEEFALANCFHKDHEVFCMDSQQTSIVLQRNSYEL